MSAADSATSPLTPIGGFFERHAPDRYGTGPNLLEAWTAGRPYAAFVNARSAFAALVATFPDATIWLPAFICRSLVHSSYAARIRFYPVEVGFEPDLARVETDAKVGDILLVTAHFGLPISRKVRDTLTRQPGLRIIEDRAQLLTSGLGAEDDSGSDWLLYSPRKLLGVADGGLLIAQDDTTPLPQPTAVADAPALWAAPQLRHEDAKGVRNAVWYSANQTKEVAMATTSEAITDLSLSILLSTSLASLAIPRLRNWRALDRRLRDWSALPSDPTSPPLGYVLSLEPSLRDKLLRTLHSERIFAAVHWPEIAGPVETFPREAQWTRELITLPCDHRYNAADMDRIAACVLGVLA